MVKNYPVYLKTTEAKSESLSDQNLKYWYTIHTSLDVIDEKTKKPEFKDLYLGLLYLIEDFRMWADVSKNWIQFNKLNSLFYCILSYGYVTSTRIKFLIIIETSNQQYHDTEIKIVRPPIWIHYIDRFAKHKI